MCGVVRIHGAEDMQVFSRYVERMVQALDHRGPDESGVESGPKAVFGATRLSIRGLESGHQPLVDAKSGVIAVCNGEIDNHRELRAWLASVGREVELETDVAVIPALYLELGAEFVERLHGAFALALYDPRENRLLLARDRVGERPLFYFQQGETIVFATEIAALASDPLLDLEPDLDALAGYMQSGSFAAPSSPFSHVRKVPPGTLIEFDAEGVRSRRYWRFGFVTTAKSAPDEDAFERVLHEAVRKQSDVDVPVGVFLSGGLDSSLIAAIACEAWPKRELRAFTLRFADDSYDEGSFAEVVARKLGIEMTSVEVRPEDVPSGLFDLVRGTGEPLADPAWVPTAKLARRAALDVKLALVGEGADELFGGYPTYIGAWLADRYQRLPSPIRRSLAWCVHALPKSEKKVTVSFLLERFVDGAALSGIERHLRWTSAISSGDLARLGVRPRPLPGSELSEGVLLDVLQRLDLEQSLGEGLLTKSDRASMSSALELRAPFLDLAVLEFAATLRPQDRVKRFETKRFLKKYALRHLPKEIVYRRKRGLSVPLGSWLRGPLHDWARARLATSGLEIAGLSTSAVLSYFDEHATRRADHARSLSALLALAEWCAWVRELQDAQSAGPTDHAELVPFARSRTATAGTGATARDFRTDVVRAPRKPEAGGETKRTRGPRPLA